MILGCRKPSLQNKGEVQVQGSYSIRRDTRKLEARIESHLAELEVGAACHFPPLSLDGGEVKGRRAVPVGVRCSDHSHSRSGGS